MKPNTKFNLPFIYQLQNQSSNPNNIPNSLTFEIENDSSSGLIKQKYSPITNDYLNEAYKLGSVIGGNTLEDEIGDNYTNNVLTYVESVLDSKDYSNKNVLEIGCGIGYLLSKFKEKNATVLGIEPGEQGQVGSEKFNIPVIQGFYPNVQIDEQFDVIISYCVLEHVPDPHKFLSDLKPLLRDNGMVFIVVPNAEPHIKVGDMSMFFHEHWSYFTESSLKNSLYMAGATNVNVECSGYGGLLLSSFSFGDLDSKIIKPPSVLTEYDDFLRSIEGNAEKIKSILNCGEEIGVYVPLRIVNYIINYGIRTDNLRFFDDDQYSYEKYFPEVDIKIENFNDFKKNPPKKVLIMTHFFEDIIKNKITKSIGNKVEIITWSQIFKN
jgi:SAM-dependent methyltransferase